MIDLMFLVLLLAVAFSFSALGSYFDLKTGEIPDKFTLGLVLVALAMRLGYSLYSGDFNVFLDGAMTGGIFFAFGALLFYTGGWGGGDAKLVTGIGASIGGLYPGLTLVDSSMQIFPPFFGFFVSLALVSIPYSIAYSLILSYKNREAVSLAKKRFKDNWIFLLLVLVLSVSLVLVLRPWNLLLLLSLVSPFLLFSLLLFMRSVEETALRKEIPVSELKEGDIVAEDVVVKGKRLVSHRDMDGITPDTIREIQKYAKKGLVGKRIKIKWGIKFGPVFPISLLLLPFWTNLIMPFF
ncbi:MAG: prepilin peptidase [Candidatus Altiarchaeota archaeon]|nr:prepilin peptidase [Candidatus Altiarchaeota archaeon]